jgi:galactokinase
MTGGGFGGCVLALIDADRAAAVTEAVTEAYAQRGFTAPTCWIATAGPGATRL